MDRRSQQQKPQQGNRIEEQKWVVKPDDEENQSPPPRQQLNIDLSTKPISEVAGFDKEKQEREAVRGTDQKSKDEVDDICNRLEEIKLVAQEPKLSEEQLRVNDRLQEEEIVALEAIYGENFIGLDREDDLRSFQINIHIDVPNQLVMYTTNGSVEGDVEFGGIGSEAMATADNLNGFLYSFKVQYLPPIVLTCLLPKAYPSRSAPFFTISVQWLDAIRISSLCEMLDMIWTDQSGKEIVYPWVDWLQNSSLSYLEFAKRIPLASFEKAGNTGDRRAISESVSPDVDIRTRFVRLPCKHFFCRNCMETYSTIHAKEGVSILCPQIKCRELVPPTLVKSLLGDAKFEQWESLLFSKTLDSMSDLVYCPRCEMACLEGEDHLAQCPKCFFSFCGLCRDRFHAGDPCMTLEEKLQLLQISQHAENHPPLTPKEQRKQLFLEQQQRKQLDKINQYLNMEEVKRTAKRCPTCRIPICRIAGCNSMLCSNCKHLFCFRCGKAYEMGKRCSIRQHLRERETQRRQEPEVLLRQERQMQNQLRIENPANHAHPCPICRQINAKVENNNHILCWSCQTNYCYLCRKIVKRISQHYGAKGCKQHSTG
ncbi:hypothetical protein MKW94_003933 [Papaver nudicaule]|uniref:RBR-type E3 ubiquitin transferase n=1 Tax=Papaver nudicaule TaxID=74823 RepID=A0AA41VXY6_PAPNU|nr:hypothetical protein [Papaver nudicaule]